MTIMTIIWFAVLFAVIFGALDGIWLKSTKAIYSKDLGHLMREKPNFIAAAVFYLLYVLAVTWFAALPVGSSLAFVALQSGLLGLICYATYDLTNYATVKGWTLRIVIMDIIWGTVATTGAAAAAYSLVNVVIK